MKKEERISRKYFFWAIIAILIILSYLMIKPYLVYIISAFILAYITKPLYSLLRKTTGKVIAALLSVLAIALVVIIPIILLIAGITEQATTLLTRDNLSEFKEKLNSLEFTQNLDIEEITRRAVEMLITLLTSALTHLPNILLGILITFFGMYYILTNWEYLENYLKKYLPVENKEETVKEISQATHGIIYGTILVGLIQFAITAIAFYLIGVKYYLLFATIIFFSAFIPGLGPGAVWVPIVIYYFAFGQYIQAIATLFVGLVLISILGDNIIRAKLLEKTAKINPYIMLLGIIGGVSVFGIFGFIVGPLVLVYTIKLIENAISE